RGALGPAPGGAERAGQHAASRQRASAGNLCPRTGEEAVMAPEPRAGAMRTRTIDVEGQRLRVAIERPRGDGTPLLLLNGLAAHLELCQPFVAPLHVSGTTLA